MVDRIREKHVVGIKQAAKAISTGNCKLLYIAEDVDAHLIDALVKKAQDADVEIIHIDTMRNLGKLCGIQVGASAAAVLIK